MQPLIVANWKCNPTTLKEAKQLFNSVKRGLKEMKGVEIVICPPFIYLSELGIGKKDSGIKLGAQDCFWEEKGAFTGQVSPLMLKDLGCEYVILGHSERRALGETNEIIDKKIKAAKKAGLKTILCIDKISQLPKDIENLIVAYEPLFAIGTGKPCSIEKAKKVRNSLKQIKIVLYGGSVNSENGESYIKEAGFQGLLVGGVSLKAKEFVQLVKNVIRP